jgi:uncharacterized protein (DUF58 family)
LETTELLKKVRKIEIKSRGLSNQIFSGEYHSAFKGTGMAFTEVREYVPGDEIRKIDWNVTARFNAPYVKVFEEERELTVMFLVDISASESFGTRHMLKRELVTEICSVLAFSAIQNNDKIGVIFFSDKIEKFIPPKKGKSHILRIIRELLNIEATTKGTNMGEALRYLTQVIKKKCTCFVLSDFMAENYLQELKIASRKHDLVGLWVYDEAEKQLPNIGFVPLQDPENGDIKWIDTSSKKVRNAYMAAAKRKEDETVTTLRKSGVDFTKIATHQSYVAPLMNLFKMRESKR